MKKKCLVISAHAPSKNALEAGHKVAYYNIIKLLSEYDVDVFCYAPLSSFGSLDDLKLIVSHVYCHPLNFLSRFRGVVSSLFRVPPRFATRLDPVAIAYVQKLIDRNDYDCIHFEFSQGCAILLRLNVQCRTQFVFHDLQIQVVLRSKRFIDKIFTHFTYVFEKKIIEKVSSVCVLSEKDRLLLDSLYSVKNVNVISPAFSEFATLVVRTPDEIKRHSLLFWGAMNRPENYEAAIYFLEKIFPLIRKKIPDISVYIVGNAPPKSLIQLSSDNVFVTGFVEDPSPYFQMASLGIVPLISGAGIKIKVLEMLAANIPVISTSVGAEGITDESLIVCDLNLFSDRVIDYFAKK